MSIGRQALQRVARFLCAGEVAAVVQRDAVPEEKVRHFWDFWWLNGMFMVI